MDMAETANMKRIIHISRVPRTFDPCVGTQIYHSERPAGRGKIDPPGLMAVYEGIYIIHWSWARLCATGKAYQAIPQYWYYDLFGGYYFHGII